MLMLNRPPRIDTYHRSGSRLAAGVPGSREPLLPIRRLTRRFHARAIIGLEIAQYVLHPGEDVFEHLRVVVVDRLVVAERFVEEPSLAFAPNPTERVIVVGALRI